MFVSYIFPFHKHGVNIKSSCVQNRGQNQSHAERALDTRSHPLGTRLVATSPLGIHTCRASGTLLAVGHMYNTSSCSRLSQALHSLNSKSMAIDDDDE